MKSWMGSDFSSPLEPEGWFWEGHMPGIHIWAPPPAAALVALAQLALSRQKRPHHVSHVFIFSEVVVAGRVAETIREGDGCLVYFTPWYLLASHSS